MNINIVELNDIRNFVTIDGIYHGGNQAWFETHESKYRHGRPGGCGVVVMADMITYMAFKNPRLYGSLVPFNPKSIKKQEYVQFMRSIYKLRRPLTNPISFVSREMTGTLGIPFPGMMKRGFQRYSAKFGGVDLNTEILSKASFNKSLSFIQKALSKNVPVGMVIWRNDKLKKFEYHWMTIVGIYKVDTTGKTMVKVATWGTIHELCLEDLYHSPNKFKMFGLITFK